MGVINVWIDQYIKNMFVNILYSHILYKLIHHASEHFGETYEYLHCEDIL